jgi:hypothetical protein
MFYCVSQGKLYLHLKTECLIHTRLRHPVVHASHALSVKFYKTFLVLNTKHLISKDKKYVIGENRDRFGNYVTGSGNSLPTFRDNVSFPSSRVKNQRRVENNSYLIRGGSLKSQIYSDYRHNWN